MSRTNNERFMLLGGEQIPHEYAITKSNQINSNNFYYDNEEGNFHPCQNDQHGSLVLSNENERHKSHHQQRNLGFPLAPQHRNYCQVHTTSVECRSRQVIQGFKRFNWMGTRHTSVQENICNLWYHGHRHSYQILMYMSWKPGPFNKSWHAF